MFLLGLWAALAAEPVDTTPIPEVFQTFAVAFEGELNEAKTLAPLAKHLDLLDFCIAVGQPSPSCVAGLRTGIESGLAKGPERTHQLLRVFREDGRIVAAYVAWDPDGIDVYEADLTETDGGTVRVADSWTFSTGLSMMTAMKMAVQSSDSEVMAARLAYQRLARAADWPAVVSAYDALDDAAKQEALYLWPRVVASIHLQDDQLAGLMETLDAVHGEQPAAWLVSLDGYALLDREDEALLRLERLTDRFGPHPQFGLLEGLLQYNGGDPAAGFATLAAVADAAPGDVEVADVRLGLHAEQEDAETVLALLKQLSEADALTIGHSTQGVDFLEWFVDTPQHEIWQAWSRGRAGLPEARPGPPADVLGAAVYEPRIRTKIGDTTAGTAFIARSPNKGRPLVLTAHHLFGESGGLTRDLTGAEMRKTVLGVGLAPIVFAGEPLEASRPYKIVDAAPFGERCDSDLAALTKVSGAPPDGGLVLAEQDAGVGSEVFLLSHPDVEGWSNLAQVTGLEDGCLLYRFEATHELSGTSGSPVVNLAGEVVGIGIGGWQDGYVTYGLAVPVSVVRARLGKL
jgi:hypothetical protein